LIYRFLIGMALSVLSIPLATRIDPHTNDAFRGRLCATMSLGSQVVSPLVVTLSGWATHPRNAGVREVMNVYFASAITAAGCHQPQVR
ncbi:MAG: hypothetical protein HUU38_22375, partial [Anaerolineales bacterium]|nr:hypothetical protein [Anaerolineales bacterium]